MPHFFATNKTNLYEADLPDRFGIKCVSYFCPYLLGGNDLNTIRTTLQNSTDSLKESNSTDEVLNEKSGIAVTNAPRYLSEVTKDLKYAQYGDRALERIWEAAPGRGLIPTLFHNVESWSYIDDLIQ